MNELVDQRVGLLGLWGCLADHLVETIARAVTLERAVDRLGAQLLQEIRRGSATDFSCGKPSTC